MKGPIPYTCDGFFLGRSVLSGPVTASALDDLVVRLSLEASVKKLTSTEESRCSVRVSCDGVSLYNQRKDEGFESDVESTSSEGGGSPKPGAVTEDTSSANSSGTESDLDLRPRADQPLDVSSSDSTDVSLPSTSSTGTSNRSLDVSWALGSVLFCHVASRHPSSVAWVTRTHGSADLEVVVVETKHSDTAQALYNAFDAHTRTDRLYRPLKKRDSANGSGGVSINNVIVPPVSAASSKKSSGHASSSSPSPIPPSWNLIQHTDPSGVTHIEIECAQSLVNAAANNGPVPSLPIVPLAFNDAPRSKEPATTAVVAAPANRAVTSLSATPLPKESPPRRLQEEREENTSEILSISTPDPPEQYGSLNRRLLKHNRQVPSWLPSDDDPIRRSASEVGWNDDGHAEILLRGSRERLSKHRQRKPAILLPHEEWIEDFPSISDVVPFRTKGSKDLGSADASSSNLEDRPQPQASSPPTATKVLLRLTDGQYLIPTKTGIEPHRTAYPKESHVVRGRYVRCSVSPYEFFPQCVFHGSTVTSEYFPSQQGPLDFPAAPAEPPHRDRKWLMDEQLLSSPPQRGIVGNRRRSRSKSPVRTRQGIKVANYVLPIQQKFREFSDTMKKFKEDVRSSMLSLGAGDQDIGGTDSTIMANGSNGVSDDTTDRLRALRITTTTTTELDFSVRSCVRRSERKKSNRGPSVEEASIASSKTPSSKRSVTFGDYAVVQLFDDDGVRRS